MSFVGAFILITAVIVYVNSQYNNIFKFDFSPPTEISPPANTLSTPDQNQPIKNDTLSFPLTKNPEKKILNIMDDSKLPENPTDNKMLKDSLNILKSEIEKLKKDKANSNNQPVKNTNKPDTKTDENNYKIWLKKTSALYASMDSKKAAKIIQNYSDNIARDILYSMNKKKAAEILAELNPETATRIKIGRAHV